jgi:hypothetical protein
MPNGLPMTIDREFGEKLSDDDIEALVGSMIDEAQDYVEDELTPERETATDYYMAREYGNEEEGRSRVVTTEVRDTVQAYLPSLARVFFGPERVVEFRPRSAEDEACARQKTDYINYIITEDNDGFMVLHSAFKDALVRKTGIIKWSWEESLDIEEVEYTGLSEEQLQALVEDDDVEMEITGVHEVAPGAPALFDASVRRETEDGRVRVEAVPTEEVLWNRSARDRDDARIIVHTREVKADDLLALGFEWDEIEDAVGKSSGYHQDNPEEAARRTDEGSDLGEEDQQEATRPVRYDEAYVGLDIEGDGKVSLHKVCMVGDNHSLLRHDPISHVPFAFFCPDPEPHTMIGLSMADYTMDLQKINSSILRGTLDSLSLSLLPATEVVEGMVNMKDAVSTEMGKLVRVRQPNMMREIKHSFVGGESLPMMQYINEIKENRTGISKAAAGLDADALQSSTKAAVAATMTGAQQHLEMVARIFAETGMKQLFRGILRTVIEHQDRERVIRLRNEYVAVDPRAWDATMDVIVNVALGAGMTEDKIQILAGIAAKQEQAIGMFGPVNPLTSMRLYRNTLARMTELAGFKNSAEFWNPITEEEEAQYMQEGAQQQEQGDPATAALAQAEMMKAQVEMEKIKADIAIAQQRLELDREEMALKDDRERDEQAADIALRIREMELKYQTDINRAAVDADVRRERAELDADVRRDVARIQSDSQGGSDGGTED